MFGDGLLYASMSRNMAEGRGSFWKPYFSSSYWLENIPDTYYENPPLMLWLQSLLFRMTGDHWWVEKVFCIFILIVNIVLLRFLWNIIFSTKEEYKKYWYLVVFWWYLIPVVIWGNVNNMMDSVLLSFCLAAIAFLIKSFEKKDKTDFIALSYAGICIFCGVLTKGPVAIYPLSIPLIYFMVKGDMKFIQLLKITLGCSFIVFFLFALLLIVETDALFFFSQYWEQRLKAVIVGSRDDMMLSGWDRLYILEQLIIELSPTVAIISFGWIYIKIKKIHIDFNDVKIYSLIFILAGLSATLPILISSKQSGIYLIPGIPMFSIAAAMLTVPIMTKLESFAWLLSHSNSIKIIFLTLFLGVIIFSVAQFGKLGRENDLIHDIELLKNIIPQGSKIGVCEEMKKEFVIHTYMQRMGKYELSSYPEKSDFVLQDHQCLILPLPADMCEYNKMDLKDLKYFQVFRKKQ